MKSFKKVLSLVLALALVLTAFVACGKKEDEKGKDGSDAEKEVQEVAEKYLDAMLDLDEETMKKFSTDKRAEELTEWFEDLNEKKTKANAKSFYGDVVEFIDEEIAGEYYFKIVELVSSKTKYEIEKVEFDGDEATVTYKKTEPDITEIKNETIINQVKEKYYSTEEGPYLEEIKAYAMKFLSEVGSDMSYDEFNKVVSTNAEAAQQWKEWIEENFDAKAYAEKTAPDGLKEMFDLYNESIEKSDKTKTEEKTMTLEKVDDEWKVAKVK